MGAGGRGLAGAGRGILTAARHPSRRALRVSRTALAAHAEKLGACRLCPRVAGRPVVAVPEAAAPLLLVGQAPGPREERERRLFAYTAGRRLFEWFARLGVSEEEFRRRVWMAATIRCFPGRAPGGGDRPPTPEEIATCTPHLEREIELLAPLTIIAVGKLAMERFLPPAPLFERVGRRFEVERAGHCFEVIPLPHPSGRSTWMVREENRALLDRALRLLSESAGWQAAFGERNQEP